MNTQQPPKVTRAILTWVCQHCGWANDNNTGPCRNCKAESQPIPPRSRRPGRPRVVRRP